MRVAALCSEGNWRQRSRHRAMKITQENVMALTAKQDRFVEEYTDSESDDRLAG